MRRQVTPDPSNETLDAEGLGLVSPATGQQVASALHGLGDTLGTTVPVVGPILGGLVGTIGDLLGGLVSRDVGDGEDDCEDEDDGMHKRGFESYVPQQASQYQGLAQEQGQALQEFVGPDGRVYEAIEAANVLPQSFGQKMYPNQLQGLNPSSFSSQASQYLSSGRQFASSVQDGGVSAESIQGAPGEIIGYLSNGLPVFSSLQGGLANTIGGAAGGVLSNSPVGGILGSVGNVAGGLPVVGGVVGGLPFLGGARPQSDSVFGVLDASPSGSAMGTATSTGTDSSSPTATSTWSDPSSTDSVMPTASSAPEGKDPIDDNDPSTFANMAAAAGSDEASASSTSMVMTTATSTDDSSATPTATMDSMSAAQGTPTPALPSQ